MLGYGISGISPYMSPLGMTGLGGYGSYSSYYNPSSMMGMGMMGMYNPAFMGQMNQAYQDIEKNQLQHAGAMHQLMLQNETQAYSDTDKAIFEKAMVDGDVQNNLRCLRDKVLEGDADGICQEYDKLKLIIYKKYNDYFKENSGTMNSVSNVNNFIKNIYSKTYSQPGAEPVDLITDIKKYGQTAFEHGFWKSFHGKDYHDKYTEEALSYIYGTPIDNQGGKERMQNIGKWTEKGTEVLAAGLAGRGLGYALGGVAKVWNPLGLCNKLGLKGTNRLSKIVSAAAVATDILWQMSRD